MNESSLHSLHARHGAQWTRVSGQEVVAHYGDVLAEHAALCKSVGVVDLSFRGRICLTGADRQRFLNGQVTNNVKDLRVGQGCYAALVTAKGKLQSDFNIYCLPDELFLDFEPRLTAAVLERFEKFIIADDVQAADVAPHYGLLRVQGPEAGAIVRALELGIAPPEVPLRFVFVTHPALGEIYCMNRPCGRNAGFDLFVPAAAMEIVAEQLLAAARPVGGRFCGWQALEMTRIEAGIPRFGIDMDDTNLAPEAGIDERAISYTKGCYIGQEVIARIRTYGQVAKALRGLWLPGDLTELPGRGEKLHQAGREVGYITSAVASFSLGRNIALGYVRRECFEPGTLLEWRAPGGVHTVEVVGLPFPDRA